MMQKNLLKYLESESRKFSNKKIFDMVVYGSFVKSKEEPNDVDVVIIFFNEKLNEMLTIAQEFKSKIRDRIKNPDVKTINLYELFDRNFLARTGIFTEGYSLLGKEPFPKKMGFDGYVIFSYSLKKLNHNEKTKFTYALIGRNKFQKGILENLNALVLGKGAVAIPVENSIFFEDFLKNWKVEYKFKQTLISK
jgi:predicted nucleotidyltransferase